MTASEELRPLSGSYYIDGGFRKSASGAGHDVIDPATEDAIGEIADCSRDEVEQAIAVANRAQRAWSAETGLRAPSACTRRRPGCARWRRCSPRC